VRCGSRAWWQQITKEIDELSFDDLLHDTPKSRKWRPPHEPDDWFHEQIDWSRFDSRANIAEVADAIDVQIAAVQEDRPRAALRKLSEAISALHADVRAIIDAMRADRFAGQESDRVAARSEACAVRTLESPLARAPSPSFAGEGAPADPRSNRGRHSGAPGSLRLPVQTARAVPPLQHLTPDLPTTASPWHATTRRARDSSTPCISRPGASWIRRQEAISCLMHYSAW
jgi:hypothetical protein